MDIADRIISWRNKKGLSQNALARIAKVSQTSLSDIEGKKKRPTITTLEKIYAALNVNEIEFYSEAFNIADKDDAPALSINSYDLSLLEKIKNLPPDKRRHMEVFLEYLSQLDKDD